MWNLLSTLPSHSRSLEEVVLIFSPFGETPERRAAELESFAWLDLVGKLQGLFPNLKTITLGVGYYVEENEDFVPYLAALRRAPGLRRLEEKGTVLLHMIPWQTYGLVRSIFSVLKQFLMEIYPAALSSMDVGYDKFVDGHDWRIITVQWVF